MRRSLPWVAVLAAFVSQAAIPSALPDGIRRLRIHKLELRHRRAFLRDARGSHEFRVKGQQSREIIEKVNGGEAVSAGKPFGNSFSIRSIVLSSDKKSLFALPADAPGGRISRFDIATRTWSDEHLPPVGTTPFSAVHETSDGQYLVTTRPLERGDEIEIQLWKIGSGHDAQALNSVVIELPTDPQDILRKSRFTSPDPRIKAPVIHAFDDKPSILVEEFDALGGHVLREINLLNGVQTAP